MATKFGLTPLNEGGLSKAPSKLMRPTDEQNTVPISEILKKNKGALKKRSKKAQPPSRSKPPSKDQPKRGKLRKGGKIKGAKGGKPPPKGKGKAPRKRGGKRNGKRKRGKRGRKGKQKAQRKAPPKPDESWSAEAALFVKNEVDDTLLNHNLDDTNANYDVTIAVNKFTMLNVSFMSIVFCIVNGLWLYSCMRSTTAINQ
eukprot:565380_1